MSSPPPDRAAAREPASPPDDGSEARPASSQESSLVYARAGSELETHGKGRRKRTAAKDKAILEAAYKANPKPDKAARLDMVERVSLDAKEVQIWFQNRRQNDRRKSRPLSPQEVAALQYGGLQMLSSDGIAYGSDKPSDAFGDESPPSGNDSSSGPVRSFSESTGYLANRWNSGSSFCSTTPGRTFLPSLQNSSQFRISLSLEGKAEVVSSVPSPPRASTQTQTSRPPLGRSQSLSASRITLPPFSALAGSLSGGGALPPRLTRGRSRDVHAWEFCCDAGSSAHDGLLAQAQHESSGSAMAAIGLLRSTSGVPLQPSHSFKRNAASATGRGVAKRAKPGRAQSSVARLQTGLAKADDVPKKVKVSMLISPSGNDSDKENWSPEDDHGVVRDNHYHHLPSGTAATAPRRGTGRLPDASALHGPSFLGSRGRNVPAGRKRGPSPLEIFEDGGSVGEEDNDDDDDDGRRSELLADDEVERFMRGEVSPSKKGDVDAVAGLLSLSQGSWR